LNYPSKTTAAVLPRWSESALSHHDATRRDNTGGLPNRTKVYGLEAWKRVLDTALGAVALVLLSPFVALVAVLVKVTSPGPVFFKQERIGLNRRTRDRRTASFRRPRDDRRDGDRRVVVKYGKPFSIYKFRTMVADAERGKPVFAQKRDPRVTPLGRILRKTRIDEIPQFLNVLKGDMSIVGPRPERAYFIDEAQKEIPDFRRRLQTKPGITGLAQVKLGYTDDISGLAKKLHFDLEYINQLSPSNDLRILAQTVRVVLTGKGAV
jgi:lipopolysaccharide/colanic/teichoic acid biosynthesis glycosyltransferase